MKRIVFIFLSLFMTVSLHAIELFPYFVDVAGDFSDGTDLKFSELNLPTKHYRSNPFFYSSISEADEFLMDSLPFSNYHIGKVSETLPDGTEIIIYSSSLVEGVFGSDAAMDDKMSYIYLIQTPNEPFYVGFYVDEL